jgi:hypothetical protein
LKRTENAVKTKTHKSQKEIFETKQAVPKLWMLQFSNCP